jgi:S1-C subfamily serine protease
MYRLLPLLAGLLAHGTALASADDGLPLSTLQPLKEATVFVKVESEGTAKVRIPRESGQAEASVELKGRKYSGSGSGFVMLVEGDTAYVVTNHHVAKPTIEVSTADFPATIVRRYTYPAPGTGRNLRVPS